MLCCDRTEVEAGEVRQIADYLAGQQRKQIVAAVARVLDVQKPPLGAVILSGSGLFLGREVVSQHLSLEKSQVISLAEAIGPGLAESACAFAVSRLAVESHF
jgi:uncharacterized hydantoinase/oxoprolinase family protein